MAGLLTSGRGISLPLPPNPTSTGWGTSEPPAGCPGRPALCLSPFTGVSWLYLDSGVHSPEGVPKSRPTPLLYRGPLSPLPSAFRLPSLETLVTFLARHRPAHPSLLHLPPPCTRPWSMSKCAHKRLWPEIQSARPGPSNPEWAWWSTLKSSAPENVFSGPLCRQEPAPTRGTQQGGGC